jgi:hypothetical protein
VAPVDGQGQRQVACLQKSHLTLEVLILARVVVLVSVSNSNS